jgi:putative transposase
MPGRHTVFDNSGNM